MNLACQLRRNRIAERHKRVEQLIDIAKDICGLVPPFVSVQDQGNRADTVVLSGRRGISKLAYFYEGNVGNA